MRERLKAFLEVRRCDLIEELEFEENA